MFGARKEVDMLLEQGLLLLDHRCVEVGVGVVKESQAQYVTTGHIFRKSAKDQ